MHHPESPTSAPIHWWGVGGGARRTLQVSGPTDVAHPRRNWPRAQTSVFEALAGDAVFDRALDRTRWASSRGVCRLVHVHFPAHHPRAQVHDLCVAFADTWPRFAPRHAEDKLGRSASQSKTMPEKWKIVEVTGLGTHVRAKIRLIKLRVNHRRPLSPTSYVHPLELPTGRPTQAPFRQTHTHTDVSRIMAALRTQHGALGGFELRCADTCTHTHIEQTHACERVDGSR